ncbi:GIN domain-containing protein [Pontibacter sp. G13]|uniref:GIN domain-containing protein n=1 Tax=Pontibacter sp. G13 TaxID=3074898 RepID=UPI002889D5BF|nr:DUF2807 domain-containing protein [Pontibacter sp. G13]WNJ18023.1 DUF2807 domain-containing protein [Pontibacter sp. G13]
MKSHLFLTVFIVSAVLFASSCGDSNSNCEAGSGAAEDFVLDFTALSGVENQTSIDVLIQESDSQTVILRTQPNLVDNFEFRVVDGILIVDIEDCIRDHDSEVILSLNQPLSEVRLSGSGSIFSQGSLSGADQVLIASSGSGSINVELAVTQALQATTSGSGNTSILAQTITSLSTASSGSGNLELEVTDPIESIESSISGSGDLSIQGSAQTHQLQISGSGDFDGYDLSTFDHELEMRASGSAQVRSSGGTLDVSISGSGDVRYRGTPGNIVSDITGSGRLIDDN